jgi:hypothetical protein
MQVFVHLIHRADLILANEWIRRTLQGFSEYGWCYRCSPLLDLADQAESLRDVFYLQTNDASVRDWRLLNVWGSFNDAFLWNE